MSLAWPIHVRPHPVATLACIHASYGCCSSAPRLRRRRRRRRSLPPSAHHWQPTRVFVTYNMATRWNGRQVPSTVRIAHSPPHPHPERDLPLSLPYLHSPASSFYRAIFHPSVLLTTRHAPLLCPTSPHLTSSRLPRLSLSLSSCNLCSPFPSLSLLLPLPVPVVSGAVFIILILILVLIFNHSSIHSFIMPSHLYFKFFFLVPSLRSEVAPCSFDS